MLQAKRRVSIIALAIAMVFGSLAMNLPKAQAASDPAAKIFDVSEGPILVEAGTNSGTLKVSYGSSSVEDNIAPAALTLIGSTTNNNVTIDGVTANVILQNINIDLSLKSNTPAIWLKNGANVVVSLSGTNIVKAGSRRAGLQVPTGTTLLINGGGSLNSTGGQNAGGEFGGAGIGGGSGENSGSITIIDGVVTANGGNDAAGIGGGCGNYSGGNGGNITIAGGTVTANGGLLAAGIGGGLCGAGGVIVITGGTVIANGGAGIGSDGSMGSGAGIGGGGGNSTVPSGASGSITILDTANVTATGGSSTQQAGGAGIGSGGSGSQAGAGAVGDAANPITIATSTSVTATSGTGIGGRDGANIGSGGTNIAGISVTPGTTPVTLILTAWAGTGGSISPSGSVFIVGGANQAFTVTANAGYSIHEVTVEGIPQTITNYSSFAFVLPNVLTPRTIMATFVISDAETPTITSQPQSSSYNQNDAAAALSVGADVSDGGTLSYQWYSNTTNSNTGGSPIPGAISASYTPPTSTTGTYYYYVVVSNTNTAVSGAQTVSVASAVATVTVRTTAPTPTPGNGSGNGSNGANGADHTYSFSQLPNIGNDYVAICNAPYRKLIHVYVDNNLLNKSQYTAWDGSTYVQLHSSYISTLNVGTHTLTLQFTDGSASGNFTIAGNNEIAGIYVFPYEGEALPVYTPSVTPSVQAISDETVEEGTIEQNVMDENEEDTIKEDAPATEGAEPTVAVPATGDNSSDILVFLLLAMLAFSGISLLKTRAKK